MHLYCKWWDVHKLHLRVPEKCEASCNEEFTCGAVINIPRATCRSNKHLVELIVQYNSSHNPPPKFQLWLKFAKSNNCHLGPYLRIDKDLQVMSPIGTLQCHSILCPIRFHTSRWSVIDHLQIKASQVSHADSFWTGIQRWKWRLQWQDFTAADCRCCFATCNSQIQCPKWNNASSWKWLVGW